MSGIIFDALSTYAAFDDVEGRISMHATLFGDDVGEGLICRIQLGAEINDASRIVAQLITGVRLGARIAQPAGDYLFAEGMGMSARLVQQDEAPDYTMLVGVLSGLALNAAGVVGYTNDLIVDLPNGAGALLFEPAGDYLLGTISPGAVLYETPGEIINYALMYQSEGYMWAYGAWSYSVFSDGVEASDSAEAQYRARVVEAALLVVAEAMRASVSRRVTEGVSASDLLRLAVRVVMAEGVVLAETLEGFARALLRAYDAVALRNPLATSASVTAAVAAAVVAVEAARGLLPTAVRDGIELVETVTDRVRALGAVLDTLLAEDVVGSQIKIIASVDDVAAALDDAALRLWALARVREGTALALRMRFGGDVYTGWVVNTATKAVSTYTNYPFNSFAVVGHAAFGASDEGLFALTGDTDAGDQIDAAIRTVLTNLGTGRKKRVPDVYLGYTSTGGLVMKVVTTDKADGERTEDWYKLTEQPAGTMREGRIKPGKGLSSVYWAFEMVNIGGADFEVDKLELLPIILERRV